ncbi:DUF6455 family protein [uncultured Roseibium sp.]|uniref:DUF6455 family protein n=1 Tax=uncultured Roseibium sp. TaxID=1936171 RepID=UPI0032167417
MRWVEEMNGRAGLMRRMLETIGAMDQIPEGTCVGQDIRLAVNRCICCEKSESCQQWLQDQSGKGIVRPPDMCPNAGLFNKWLDNAPQDADA